MPAIIGQHIALGMALGVAGCGWLKDTSCQPGTSSCSGDAVRLCAPDSEASVESGEPTYRWAIQSRCEDDEQLGPMACGIVRGKASCVPERSREDVPDRTEAERPRDGTWLRVDVTREGETMWLATEGTVHLSDAPASAASGVAAAVTYRDDTVVDAALVPMDGSTNHGTAWVRSDGANRVALVSETGSLLAVTQLPPDSVPMGPLAPEVTPPAQSRALPPTLVVERRGGLPTPEMLDLATEAFRRIPLAAASVVTGMAFTTDAPGFRVRRDGTKLVVNMHPALLDEYRRSSLLLTLELVRTIGRAIAEVVYAVADKRVLAGAKPPSAFPLEIQKAVEARFSPMLRPNESFEGTWAGLHQIAVDGQFGHGYVRNTFRAPPDDAQAVQEGFASAAGALSPLDDFVEFFTLAHVPEAWAFGPCGALRGVPLDQLAPQWFVPLSKLLVLHGLDLLAAEKLQECVGELQLSTNEPNITLHKANGDRIVLTDELEGIRQPYFDEEVELSWSAKRSYLSASLSVGYRGYRPLVIRLNPVAGHEGKDGRTEDDYAATLAFTNPASGYSTAVAQAGLVAVTAVREDKMEAFALMVRLNREIADTKIYPLISAQVSKPVWGVPLG